MTAPTLELRDLRTHFATRGGVVKAVDGVSLRVDRGQVLGLVGPQPCGEGHGEGKARRHLLELVRVARRQLLDHLQHGEHYTRHERIG